MKEFKVKTKGGKYETIVNAESHADAVSKIAKTHTNKNITWVSECVSKL